MTKRKEESQKSRIEKVAEWLNENGYVWCVVERMGYHWFNLFDCRNPNDIKFLRTFRKPIDMADWVIANLVETTGSYPPVSGDDSGPRLKIFDGETD